MRETPDKLPNDIAALKALVRAALRQREEVLREREALGSERDRLRGECDAAVQQAESNSQRVRELELALLLKTQELDWYKKRYYGPRADKLKSEAELGQLLLEFSERLGHKPVNPDDAGNAGPEPDQPRRKGRKRGGRPNLAACEHLPVREFVHELSAAERACPGCGGERAEMGFEESWQLEYVPGRLQRLHHLRKKYACGACEQAGENPEIVAASKPPQVIERGMAGPGLLAFIATGKFHDYLPLYRLEGIFQRAGLAISRATMSSWLGDVADLLEPLYELMASRVRLSHVVMTDDTTMPMLDPGAGQTRTARMWIYRGDGHYPYNVFDFTLSRKRDGPANFLKGYSQILVADAYGGYDGVVAGNRITRAGCMAHVRRKFVECEKLAPAIAREAAALLRLLYKIEDEMAAADTAARLRARQERSAPLLAQFRERLEDWKRELLPKHPLTEAVNYALNQWETLTVFIGDGAVPIDNNASEREMKRVVLNRKNSLFVGNPRGGRTAAILSSFTSTSKRHRVDPQLYLTQLLVNLPGWPVGDLAAWLPDEWKRRQAALAPAPAHHATPAR